MIFKSQILATKEEATPILAVRQLTLTGFRNHGELRLSLSSAPVIFSGANGSGKTNILEAVSLLVPGRGLRRAALSEIQTLRTISSWAVSAQLDGLYGPLHIGTGRDDEATETERRVVQIDGRPARNQQMLSEHIAMTWITPDMDRVLAEGASARRKLLDRLVYSFDPAHSGRVQRYEKALRERLFLLREGRADKMWLHALEESLARDGVAIAAARRQLLGQLQGAINETVSAFPQADLALQGLAEAALEQKPALLVEDDLREALMRARASDGETGTSSIGPHRSDMRVTHRAKQCPAELCSTGEQKALLIALILAFVRVLQQARRMVPLLLLDDIAAHLDPVRRAALFDEILHLRVQAWLTGTDAAQFAELLPEAQHFRIENGMVVKT